jgi:branched-subunit amino acid transport protein
MRTYIFFVRLAVFAALIASSVLCAGWKWGSIAH